MEGNEEWQEACFLAQMNQKSAQHAAQRRRRLAVRACRERQLTAAVLWMLGVASVQMMLILALLCLA